MYGYWKSDLVITHLTYTLYYNASVTEPKELARFKIESPRDSVSEDSR